MSENAMVQARFSSAFRITGRSDDPTTWEEDHLVLVSGYRDFASAYSGVAFEEGLYRMHNADSGRLGLELIQSAFPEFTGRAFPFAYDWLGRQFAVDEKRRKGGEPLVLLLEPGTGQGLEIPLSFEEFHDQLNELREPALAASFFDQWARANPSALPLMPRQVVGYKIPLFLGGQDTVDNLETTDLDVYWTILGQLRNGATKPR